MLSGQFNGGARAGILIGSTADDGEGDGARELPFEGLLSAAGPIAVDLIDADGGAVAGVTGEQGGDGSVGVGDAEDGERVIDGAGGILASVGGEGDGANPPGHAGGFPVCEGAEGDLFEGVGEFPGVAFDDGLMFGGDVHAEEVGQDAGNHWSAVGVAGADGETLILDRSFGGETLEEFGAYPCGNAAVVDGEQNGWSVCRVVSEGKGLCVDALSDALVGLAAAAVAAEADGVIGGDVAACDSDWKQRRGACWVGLCEEAGWGKCEEREEQAEAEREQAAEGSVRFHGGNEWRSFTTEIGRGVESLC